jgi:catechol 2,3-dioxygenase-like lactoylglutathione lyase family enzyme
VDVLSSRILLRPSDLDRSRRFYRDRLGLAVYREFGPPDDPGTTNRMPHASTHHGNAAIQRSSCRGRCGHRQQMSIEWLSAARSGVRMGHG